MNKLDDRFLKHAKWMVACIVALAMTGIVAGAMGLGLKSRPLILVLAGFCVALALYGIGYSIWMWHFYRCPTCGRRIRPTVTKHPTWFDLTYNCETCGVEWETGIKWGGD